MIHKKISAKAKCKCGATMICIGLKWRCTSIYGKRRLETTSKASRRN